MKILRKRHPVRSNRASFVLYSALVVSAALGLFPPFTGLGGIEHAFVLSGPQWSRELGEAGRELGLEARIDWLALVVQLGAVWAIALGAKWFFGDSEARPAKSLEE